METAFAPLIRRRLQQLKRRRGFDVLLLVAIVLYCLYAFSGALGADPAAEFAHFTHFDEQPDGFGAWLTQAADFIDAKALLQSAPVLLLGPMLLKDLKDIDFQLLHLEIAAIYAASGDPRWRDHFQDARSLGREGVGAMGVVENLIS